MSKRKKIYWIKLHPEKNTKGHELKVRSYRSNKSGHRGIFIHRWSGSVKGDGIINNKGGWTIQNGDFLKDIQEITDPSQRTIRGRNIAAEKFLMMTFQLNMKKTK